MTQDETQRVKLAAKHLLKRLDALPRQAFEGEVFRATRQSLNPLAASYNGGRWMPPDAAAVLYTSPVHEGAPAEIAFHWGQLSPPPSKPVVVHRLRVAVRRTLRLIRADLAMLGVPEITTRAPTCHARKKSARLWSSWPATASLRLPRVGTATT